MPPVMLYFPDIKDILNRILLCNSTWFKMSKIKYRVGRMENWNFEFDIR